MRLNALRDTLLASIALLSVTGCMRIDPDHPYDPESPLEYRVPATVEGRILLPDEPSGFSYLSFEVTLTNSDYPDEHRYPVPVSTEGTFRIEGILAGDYIITADGEVQNGEEARRFVLPKQALYLPSGQLSTFATPFVLRPVELVSPELLPDP